MPNHALAFTCIHSNTATESTRLHCKNTNTEVVV